jgi:hypothetical protein
VLRLLDDRSALASMGEKAWQRLLPFSYAVAIERVSQLLRIVDR